MADGHYPRRSPMQVAALAAEELRHLDHRYYARRNGGVRRGRKAEDEVRRVRWRARTHELEAIVIAGFEGFNWTDDRYLLGRVLCDIPEIVRQRCSLMAKRRDPMWRFVASVCDGTEMSLDWIGLLYGVSYERARQWSDLARAKIMADRSYRDLEAPSHRHTYADECELRGAA